MKFPLVIMVCLLCFVGTLSSQSSIPSQLNFSIGPAYSLLNDELWGGQTYKGRNTNYELGFSWGKEKRVNQVRLDFAQGNIAVPFSIRRKTLDLHFAVQYHHLRQVRTLGKRKIEWWTGAGLAPFLDLRIHQQYSSNNAASYNFGLGLQWQNLFQKAFPLSQKRQIKTSILIEQTLLSALMTPDYASTNPEKALDINGLNDLTFKGIVERMKLKSIPDFWRVNFHTLFDYMENPKLGFRAQYIWSLVHSNQRLQFTGARHQLLIGILIKL